MVGIPFNDGPRNCFADCIQYFARNMLLFDLSRLTFSFDEYLMHLCRQGESNRRSAKPPKYQLISLIFQSAVTSLLKQLEGRRWAENDPEELPFPKSGETYQKN